jgi:hypothetical protein
MLPLSLSRRTALRAAALLPALALLGGATLPDDWEALVAAERLFAADAGRIGITPAFLAHVAPEGMLLLAAPRPAKALLAGQSDTPGDTLEWQPETGAVARSGDLGFTTGPYVQRTGAAVVHGRFLTVWRHDGVRWRWLIDGGVQLGSGRAAMPLAVSRIASGAASAAAGDELAAADARANRDGPAGLRAAGAQVLRADLAELGSGEALGHGQSRAGDLGYSFGRGQGADGRKARYFRVWRRDAGGWMLIADAVSPAA